MMHKRYTCFIFLLLFLTVRVSAQQSDRFKVMQEKLEQLALTVTGLHDKVQLSINGASIQDYIRALSKSNGLSINIDPKLSIRVTNDFNNVTAEDILLFLAKTYSLDISLTGSIINISQYQDSVQNLHPVKQIKAIYNPMNNALSVELDNDSLYAVARKITQVSGKNIVVTPGLSGKKVTSFIANAPFDNALEKLAYANDIKMVKTSDDFYMFQSLNEGEELYVNGDRNTATRRTFKPVANASGGNLGLYSRTVSGQKLISCEATNASILDIVKAASLEMSKSYFLYSDLKGTVTSHVTDMTYDDFLNTVFRGSDYTFRMENGVYLLGERKMEGLRTNRIVLLQNRPIDTIIAAIPAEWKKGVEIKEFREQNSLLLSGSGPQIDELAYYINSLDKLVPMVMIEVIMVDINKSKTNSSGITIGVADSVKTGGTLLSGFDFTFGASSINSFLDKVGGSYLNLGHVVPNFYANIKALEAHDNVEVHSIPRMTTLNGHNATITQGSTRYYLVQTQNVIQSISSPTINFTQQYNKIDANMVINIKPIVSGDDQVTLGIKIDITDFIGTPPANAPAPTSTSKYESIIRAHNEDMIVLGGLERTQESESTSGTPFLSRIPIIKYLFSTRTKTVAKITTLVFIKPTIIR